MIWIYFTYEFTYQSSCKDLSEDVLYNWKNRIFYCVFKFIVLLLPSLFLYLLSEGISNGKEQEVFSGNFIMYWLLSISAAQYAINNAIQRQRKIIWGEYEMSSRYQIIIDPKMKLPIIQDTRIPVSTIISSIASHCDFSKFQEEYPDLSHDDIKLALHYASQISLYSLGKIHYFIDTDAERFREHQ